MNDIIRTIRNTFAPIHKEGHLYVGIGVVLTIILGSLWSPFGWIGTIITIWICYFFRDPVRVSPVDEKLIISPADGRVSMITKAIPPEEMDLPKEPMVRISVFMNVFDCHVNRSPAAGTIKQIKYSPGVFLNAELDKASDENERNAFVLETEYGKIGFVQIAGFVARRIVSFVDEGKKLQAGERFGLIKFGSRLDVYIPDTANILVGVGQRAIAGETVLASMEENSGERVFRSA